MLPASNAVISLIISLSLACLLNKRKREKMKMGFYQVQKRKKGMRNDILYCKLQIVLVVIRHNIDVGNFGGGGLVDGIYCFVLRFLQSVPIFVVCSLALYTYAFLSCAPSHSLPFTHFSHCYLHSVSFSMFFLFLALFLYSPPFPPSQSLLLSYSTPCLFFLSHSLSFLHSLYSPSISPSLFPHSPSISPSLSKQTHLSSLNNETIKKNIACLAA